MIRTRRLEGRLRRLRLGLGLGRGREKLGQAIGFAALSGRRQGVGGCRVVGRGIRRSTRHRKKTRVKHARSKDADERWEVKSE